MEIRDLFQVLVIKTINNGNPNCLCIQGIQQAVGSFNIDIMKVPVNLIRLFAR